MFGIAQDSKASIAVLTINSNQNLENSAVNKLFQLNVID